MTRDFNENLEFQYPEAFTRAKEKYIVIREVYTTVFNPHIPQSVPVDNLMLYGDFVDENECHNYVALSNSPNMKKKRCHITSRAQSFKIWFKTIDGQPFYPELYTSDFLIRFM
jgi:hypothetical protein